MPDPNFNKLQEKSDPSGFWIGNYGNILKGKDIFHLISRVSAPVNIVRTDDGLGAAKTGQAILGGFSEIPSQSLPLLAYLPALPPEKLGDPGFLLDYGLKYPYIGGSMANGISSVEMSEAFGREGMLGFFGAGGLSLNRISEAIDILHEKSKNAYICGFNLIHSPNEPIIENETVNLYIRKKVRLIEASAFLGLTLPLLRYRLHGIHRGEDGRIITPNRIIAKASRTEVATRFFSPPPEALLNELVRSGELTKEQAQIAQEIPVAPDLTAEADSGGHTDNRSALALLPTMLALRDSLVKKYGYSLPLRVGAAGGIGTPVAAAACFSMGASWILTGSINQACIEAGTSDAVRKMLAEASEADIVMAPAADMFEMGVKVQVLKRGTMFAMRAARLYELYRKYKGIDEIPLSERLQIEKTIFHAPLTQVWEETVKFLEKRDPERIQRAENDPGMKMALIFRWYLGQASKWANQGREDRRIDYQVWCGPALGAFNEWTKNSFLSSPENRKVVDIALNILHGASVALRVSDLQRQGIETGLSVQPEPLPLEVLQEYMK